MTTRVRTNAEAELSAAQLMREWGYLDATALPGGPDGGIDVYSSRAYAAVSWGGDPVTATEVESLYSGRGLGRRDLLYFSGAPYADSALIYADSAGVALFTIDSAGKAEPINSSAKAVLAGIRADGTRKSSTLAAPVVSAGTAGSGSGIGARNNSAAAQASVARTNVESASRVAGSVFRPVTARVGALLRAYWRILAALAFTAILVVAPFGSDMVALRVSATLIAVVGTPLCWILAYQHHKAALSRR